MLLRGVPAICAYLGVKSAKGWRALKARHLPYYRDAANPTAVWAFTEELDRWIKLFPAHPPHMRPPVKQKRSRA